MKRTNNDMDDTFSFDMGGMNEFFPLEDQGNGKPETAPTGVKGYLKNVAKSVKNLGYKVGKHLYPDAFNLGEDIFDNSDAGSRISAKQAISQIKSKAKEYKNVANDVIKEISNDAKTAIKTGYFVKSEEESMDMGNAFGDLLGDDFDIDGDFSYNDLTDFGDSGTGDDEFGDGSITSHLSTSETIVKAEAASTLATLKSNTKIRSTIAGAAQAQIKNESLRFAQQIEIENERHRQKMGVLRNIATNIGKQIEQNNVSIRAQMEFSAKSLAFAQDTAAMLKEVRQAAFKLSNPKTVTEDKHTSDYEKIYGDGTRFNKKAFIENFKQVSTANSFGGALDSIKMIPEMIGQFTSMGMSPAQAIKSMGGDMIRDGIVDAMIKDSTKVNMRRFNDAIRGLPAAFNRKMLQWSEDDSVSNVLNKVGDALPSFIGDKIKNNETISNFIREQLGFASVRDSVNTLTKRYELGNPNDIHPFDNKAHTYLTEVIPHYLSNIDAGVNHRAPTTFDWKSGRFLTSKDIKQIVDTSQRELIRSNMGYSEAESAFGTALSDHANDLKVDTTNLTTTDHKYIDSDGKPKTSEFTKEFDKLLGNFQRYNYGYKTLESESDLESIKGNILRGTQLAKASTEIQDYAMKMFRRGIRDMMGTWSVDADGKETLVSENKAGKESLIQLMSDQGSYINRMNTLNRELEDRFSGGGSSINYRKLMADDMVTESRIEYERQLQIAERQVQHAKDALDKAVANGKTSDITIKKVAFNRALDTLNEKKKGLAEFNKTSKIAMVDNDIDPSTSKSSFKFDNEISTEDNFDKYRMNALEDTSTHGLIQNIYNLLLSGIDVYTHSPKKEDDPRSNFLNNAKSTLSKARSESINRNNAIDDYDWVELSEWDIPAFIDFNYPIYIRNGKTYDKIDSKTREMLKKNPSDDSNVWYAKQSDINAVNTKQQRKHQGYVSETTADKLEKIPIFGKGVKFFNKLNAGLSSTGLDFLGKNFYDIENLSSITGDEKLDKEIKKAKDAFTKKKDEVKESVKSKASTIKAKGKEYVQDTKDFYKGEGKYNTENNVSKGSVIDAALHLTHKATDDFKQTKLAQLPSKVKNAYNDAHKENESALKTLSSLFSKTSVGEKISSLWKSEQEAFNNLKKDVTTSNEYIEVVKAKDELINSIKDSDVYKQLSDKQKEIFDKLDVENKKNKAVEKIKSVTDSIKTTVTEKTQVAKDAFTKKKDEVINSKTVQDIKSKATGFIDDVKKSAVSETLGKYKEAAKNEVLKNTVQKDVKNLESKLMKTKILPHVKKELSKELMNIRNKHNIPLSNAINRIKDPLFHSELGQKTDTMDKARYILGKADNIDEFNSFKEPLSKFIEKRGYMDDINKIGTAGAIGYIVGRAADKLRQKVDDKAKGLLNKVLDKKLLAIKVGDKTLGEVLDDIIKTDPSIKEYIDAGKTPVDKANIILRLQNPELKPYKAEIRKFAEDYDQSTALGIAGTMAWNTAKSVASKAWNWIKNLSEGDKEKEELVKLLGKDITKILGGEDNVENTLLSAHLSLEDIKALKTTDPIKISQFLISEGKFKRNTKKQLMVFIKLTMDKRATRAELSSDNEFTRNVARSRLKDIHDQIESNNEELDKKEYKEAKKSEVVKATLKRKPSRLESSDDGIVNTTKEMAEDKEKKKQTEQLAIMADNIKIVGDWAKKATKDGIDLSKGTMKGIDESNKEAAENMSDAVSGSDGIISKLLNKVTGGKFGQLTDGLTKVSSLAGKGGILGKIGSGAGKLLGMGSSASAAIGGATKGIAGATAKGGLKAGLKTAATTAGKAAAGGAKGIIGAAKNAIGKILDIVLSKIGGKAAITTMMNTVKKKIISLLPKFVTRLGSKLIALGPLAATGIGMLAMAAAGFAKGCTKAKDYFRVGKGMRITTGMRMAAGLADAVDMALLEIPNAIASICGFGNTALWFYDIAGGDAEKAALMRYKKYNTKRAMIFGVDDPDALVAYENRSQGEGFGGTLKTGLNRGLRALGNTLTFGLMQNNDEKDAEILGFKHVKIFQKWKTEKYEPLNNMRITMADAYGGLKVVEDIYAADQEDLDKDADGQIDQDKEAQDMYNMIQKQTDYRAKYLEAARKYVLDMNLAYLTTHCTIEDFEKYSGQSAGEEIKSGGARVKAAAKKAWQSTITYKAGKFVVDSFKNGLGNTVKANFKKFGEKARKLMDSLGFNKKQKDMMEMAQNAIVQTENEVDPTYHNDKVDDIQVKDNPETASGESVVNVGSNGGPESTNDGYFVRTKTVTEPTKHNTTEFKRNQAVTKESPRNVPSLDNSYDLSGRVSKQLVMKSITEDFANNFGKELNKRLDILKEMHKEQVRHNEVSENFFTSAIGFLATIAKNTGNIQMSNTLDSMIKQVTAL